MQKDLLSGRGEIVTVTKIKKEGDTDYTVEVKTPTGYGSWYLEDDDPVFFKIK